MNLLDTIAAISTPPGRSAIGVVRISGTDALPVVRNFVRTGKGIQPRFGHLGRLLDAAGDVVDEVVITWYAGPRSYTGEDVVELACHGSPAILGFCLEQAIHHGARLAEPGEFTLRAYLRGKIDLPQAEAVRDLIEATTLYQAKVAAQQKEGALSRRLSPIKQQLIDLVALLEAGIDFAEDDVSIAPTGEIIRRIDSVLCAVRRMAQSFSWGRLVTEGFSIAIAGAPNSGKSSLFNALLREDRAIVTPIPGTTRDPVSESLDIGGIPCRLVDTAGIRETTELVESLGIERTFEAIADASITLLVLDASSEYSDPKDLMARAGGGGHFLLIANKCDLPHSQLPSEFIQVSALTGAGIHELKLAILQALSPGNERLETGFVTSLRQKGLLDESIAMLQKAGEAAANEIPHEMLLLDLYCALRPLDAISGKTTADDILHHIFGKFCIGK